MERSTNYVNVGKISELNRISFQIASVNFTIIKKVLITQKEAAVAAVSAMYKRPVEELVPCFEEAATVYEFDENDKMNWSKIVCFWFADEVFYGANQRAIEQQKEQPIFLYNLDVKMRCYHEDPWKVSFEATIY